MSDDRMGEAPGRRSCRRACREVHRQGPAAADREARAGPRVLDRRVGEDRGDLGLANDRGAHATATMRQTGHRKRQRG